MSLKVTFSDNGVVLLRIFFTMLLQLVAGTKSAEKIFGLKRSRDMSSGTYF
jgi:hypothetical protein